VSREDNCILDLLVVPGIVIGIPFTFLTNRPGGYSGGNMQGVAFLISSFPF